MAIPDVKFELGKPIRPPRMMRDGTINTSGEQQHIVIDAEQLSIKVEVQDFADDLAILRFDADDAERLGVLLQYAAMKARENGEANASV